jgi:hypothetical protein
MIQRFAKGLYAFKTSIGFSKYSKSPIAMPKSYLSLRGTISLLKSVIISAVSTLSKPVYLETFTPFFGIK